MLRREGFQPFGNAGLLGGAAGALQQLHRTITGIPMTSSLFSDNQSAACGLPRKKSISTSESTSTVGSAMRALLGASPQFPGELDAVRDVSAILPDAEQARSEQVGPRSACQAWLLHGPDNHFRRARRNFVRHLDDQTVVGWNDSLDRRALHDPLAGITPFRGCALPKASSGATPPLEAVDGVLARNGAGS